MSCRSGVRHHPAHAAADAGTIEGLPPRRSSCNFRLRTAQHRSHALLYWITPFLFLLSLFPSLLPAQPLMPSIPVNKSRSLTIGFLGSTNLPNSNTQAGGAPALFAARLAVLHVNSQAELLPDTQLILINNNTNSDAGTGNIMAFDQIQNRGVVALIGEYNSGVSITVAYPSRYYEIPQISYGSTSPDFTTFHDTLYPYFLRMCPSQNLESILLAHLINSQGWNRVGLVYTTDSPGAAGAQSFQKEASKIGIQVVGSAAFAFGAALPDVYFQMNSLKATGATIFLFIGAINDMQSIITVCTQGFENQPPISIYGTGYQWIGLHSYMYTTLFTNSSGFIIPHFLEFAQGIIGLQNFADVNSTWYASYAQAWVNSDKQPDLPSVDPKNPASLVIPAHFSYDAVWFYARAIHRMISEFNVDLRNATSDDKALFLAVLKNVTFRGVSGPIRVDANGDRYAPFNIVNIQGDQIVTIGTVTSVGVVTYNSLDILYMGGDKAQDYVVRGVREISFSCRVGMLIATLFCIILVLLGLLSLAALRNKAVFKAASPPFVALMLVGVLLLLSSMFPRIYENYDGGRISRCLADLFLTNYAYTLIVGSMLMKAMKVHSISSKHRIFRQSALTNAQLGIGLFILMLIQTILLIGISKGDEMILQTSAYDSDEDYIYCSSQRQATVYVAVIYTFRFALLFVTAIYSFRIRDIPHEFNESKQLGFSIYNLLFLSILLPIIDQAIGRGKSSAVIAYGISIFVIALATTGIILLPKLTMHFFMLTDPYYLNNMTNSAYVGNSSSAHSKSDQGVQVERGSLNGAIDRIGGGNKAHLPLPFGQHHASSTQGHHSPNHSPRGSHQHGFHFNSTSAGSNVGMHHPPGGHTLLSGGGNAGHHNSAISRKSSTRHSGRINPHHHFYPNHANFAHINSYHGSPSPPPPGAAVAPLPFVDSSPHAAPRMHVGRGVTTQLIALLVQHLSNNQAVAAEQALMDAEAQRVASQTSSGNGSSSDGSGSGSARHSPTSGNSSIRFTLPPTACSTVLSNSVAPSVPSIPEGFDLA